MSHIKIAVGAPTYNSSTRIRDLLTSIQLYTDYSELEYKLVIVDDGTSNPNTLMELRTVCESFRVPLVEHIDNRGIPASWNTLSRYYDCDYVILFNDDIQICNANWMKAMLYFLESNENVGTVGFPLYHMNPATNAIRINLPKPTFDSIPGVVGAPVGCAFAFKRSIFDEIGGFWEDLISFYEETDFGFECNKRGYRCYMLPFPPVEHWSSQTFGENINLSVRKPDESILPMEQYRKIVQDTYSPERIEPAPGYVYRMDYSRVMFALKWQTKDLINQPQVEVHHRVVYPLPKRNIKWLDQNMKTTEAIL